MSNNVNALQSSSDQAMLVEQNHPNPFMNSTSIGYYIPNKTLKAYICIYDLQGKQIKKYEVQQKGSIVINGGELYPGMFLYNLIVDGKEIDAKKMTLTE